MTGTTGIARRIAPAKRERILVAEFHAPSTSHWVADVFQYDRLIGERGSPSRGRVRLSATDPAAEAYRQTGEAFVCRSARRKIPSGGELSHDIRFVGEGDAGAVRALHLELRVHSREGVQRTLTILADDASVLVERATGAALPDAARGAILGATPGEWPVGEHVVSLRRQTAGVRVFELRVSLQ
jgi:hypothetical protein